MSVLAVSTGCETAEIPDESPYEEILIGMIPDLPDLPLFPELHWKLEENGRYSISEEDADRLLRFEIERYQSELRVITDSLFQNMGSSSSS